MNILDHIYKKEEPVISNKEGVYTKNKIEECYQCLKFLEDLVNDPVYTDTEKVDKMKATLGGYIWKMKNNIKFIESNLKR